VWLFACPARFFFWEARWASGYTLQLDLWNSDASLRQLLRRTARDIRADHHDRDTGRSKGFGFVEMAVTPSQAAIGALNGKEVDGRALTVNEARPKTEGGGGAAARRWGAGGAGI